MKLNIVIIEDDPKISELIEYTLISHGHNVLTFDNANDALIFLNQNKPDLIILDLMLPGLQGEDFLSFIKSKDETKNIPVLIVTAKTQDDLFAKLLDRGADDFLIKPFSIKVLVAKINAIMRRIKGIEEKTIRMGGIELKEDEYAVYVDDKQVYLTKTEFLILKQFMRNPGKVFTREQILNLVWGNDVDVSDRTVDVHVSKLRKKLGKKGTYIVSIPRVGYKFKL